MPINLKPWKPRRKSDTDVGNASEILPVLKYGRIIEQPRTSQKKPPSGEQNWNKLKILKSEMASVMSAQTLNYFDNLYCRWAHQIKANYHENLTDRESYKVKNGPTQTPNCATGAPQVASVRLRCGFGSPSASIISPIKSTINRLTTNTYKPGHRTCWTIRISEWHWSIYGGMDTSKKNLLMKNIFVFDFELLIGAR